MIKTLGLIRNKQHKLYFENSKKILPEELCVFRAIFILSSKSNFEAYQILKLTPNDVVEKIRLFYDLHSESLDVGMINLMESANPSYQTLYICLKLLQPFINCFNPGFFTKFSSTIALIIFPLKEVLSHHGVFIDKSTVMENSKEFNDYCLSKAERGIKYSL